MSHAIKVGKAELTISDERLVRHIDRMRNWSTEKRAYAHSAAERRLNGKYPRERDAAIWGASRLGEA